MPAILPVTPRSTVFPCNIAFSSFFDVHAFYICFTLTVLSVIATSFSSVRFFIQHFIEEIKNLYYRVRKNTVLRRSFVKATQITRDRCARLSQSRCSPEIYVYRCPTPMGNGNDTLSSLLIMSGNRPCICLLISRNSLSHIHVRGFFTQMQMFPQITHCFCNLTQIWITMYSLIQSAVCVLTSAIFPAEITQKPPTLLPASKRSRRDLSPSEERRAHLSLYTTAEEKFPVLKNAMPSFSSLKNLDSHKYLVIRSDYCNRPNNPPIPVLIIRQ